VARLLAADPAELGRSVLVAAFDAEEPPNYLTSTMGSVVFALQPTVPLDRIDQMICLDIVGRRLGGGGVPDEVGKSLFLLGGERSAAGEMVDALAGSVEGIALRRADADLVPPMSDYFAFEQAHVPFLSLTAGRSPVYHTPADTADRLHPPKMAALAELVAGLVVELSHASGIGEYREGARNDPATLRSLAVMLEALATVDPEALVALDRVDRAFGRLDGDRLPEADHQRLTDLVLALEAHLGALER
jgi:Zn-dependent M28 family amino/carboxypeptidase